MIGNKWDDILRDEYDKCYFKELMKFMDEEYRTKTIFPPYEDIFNSLKRTDFDNVKVVILGQDPYHGYGQAHGLAFSVKDGVKPPPSLRNIYKEIEAEYNIDNGDYGCLNKWADQGVLLLNTVLTVREGEANSHKKMGWEKFTDAVIKGLNNKNNPVVFLLWGKPAQSKKKLINGKHLLLESTHPSPLSAYRGFFGCGHFKITNDFLKENYGIEIDWSVK